MTQIDHERFASLMSRLYAIVSELEAMFPGRHFTPDGHMVGSIGESLVADAYDLSLMTASNEGYDAVAPDGKQVEIKATQSKSVAFRSCPAYAIVIRILPNGTFETCYNGPGQVVWDTFQTKKPQKNGQFQISLTQLRKLDQSVLESERIPLPSRDESA